MESNVNEKPAMILNAKNVILYQRKWHYSCIRNYRRNAFHRTITTAMSIDVDPCRLHRQIIVIVQSIVIMSIEMVCSTFMIIKITHRLAGICQLLLHRQIIEMVQITQVTMAAMISSMRAAHLRFCLACSSNYLAEVSLLVYDYDYGNEWKNEN